MKFVLRRQQTAASLVQSSCVLLALAACVVELQAQTAPSVTRVPREDVVQAMREEQHTGYNLRLTANAVRLQAGVILRLAHAAQERVPQGPPLLLHHADYFSAYLEVLGLHAADAPTFIRIACEYREDQVVEYSFDRVVRKVVAGPSPKFAVTVLGGWSGDARAYSYEDTTSSPHARISHERRNSYRLLQYDDMLVHDDVRGIGGRATSGVLGVIFGVIGYGWATHSRTALASDGFQVMHARAKKGFISVSQTVTIDPNGRVETGVPGGRRDLKELERRLQQPIRLEYVPLPADGWLLSRGAETVSAECDK